ncbi:hypothetical protein D9757_006686 [Collybiopsis confluens]|uniref:SPRY domain-containing protein n=1 Tax=Collybiopsis confluens TaxID=2823264 RepID=A0A8H5MAC7_9AGAR|nr:hypothetical protein D9757_006686 [Collybiopsis confluens]
MISLFKSLKPHSDKEKTSRYTHSAPPGWTPAPEISHTHGQYEDAPDNEYQDGISFCLKYSLHRPALLPSYITDQIQSQGARAWGLEDPHTSRSSSTQYSPYSNRYRNRFSGKVQNISKDSKSGDPNVVRVTTTEKCKDFCILSDLPIAAGLYDTFGRKGVYFEVMIHEMDAPTSFITLGTACKPYPTFRQPGWNRESSGWHLDDLRKFFEDSDGGRDYTDNGRSLPLPWKYEAKSKSKSLYHSTTSESTQTQFIPDGSIIGCGYVFQTGTIFYTYNGLRLPNAFDGAHLPRGELDVYAAIGFCGRTRFDVNFGGETFKWLDGNTWEWRVEGIAGRLGSGMGESSGMAVDELPPYSR